MSADLAAVALVVGVGEFTLGPVDLEVATGEYLVVVGPSGAGKTVLVETLLGWHRPRSGTALLEGRPVTSIAPGERRLAYLPQDLGILPHRTARANLTWGLECRRTPADPELLDRVVAVLNLRDVLGRGDPTTLSRGEQQRLALGRALLTRPRRLVLDEPCAALDPHRRRELQLLLKTLHREFGATVVHVTHDREEAFLLGQRVAVVLAGRLHQVSTPAALYAAPADVDVARFLAPENLWPCTLVGRDGDATIVRIAGTTAELSLGTGGRAQPDPHPVAGSRTDVPAPAPRALGHVFVGIRPEEAMILDPTRPLRPQVAQNVFAGTISDVLLLDGRVQVVVACAPGFAVVSRLSVCAVEDLGLTAGATVRVSLKARSLYLLDM